MFIHGSENGNFCMCQQKPVNFSYCVIDEKSDISEWADVHFNTRGILCGLSPDQFLLYYLSAFHSESNKFFDKPCLPY